MELLSPPRCQCVSKAQPVNGPSWEDLPPHSPYQYQCAVKLLPAKAQLLQHLPEALANHVLEYLIECDLCHGDNSWFEEAELFRLACCGRYTCRTCLEGGSSCYLCKQPCCEDCAPKGNFCGSDRCLELRRGPLSTPLTNTPVKRKYPD